VTFQPEELIVFEEPNPEAELGWGPGCARVALVAAGLLGNTDVYASGYFKRGAIPAFILSVDGMPGDAEMRKLETWWKKVLGDVKKAFETVAVRAAVKPQLLGSPMKDLAMPELTASKRQDIATALGIPMGIMFSEAANYATAEVDDRNFATKTITPRCDFIAKRFNDSEPLRTAGVKLKFKPQELEVFQKYESEKAVALMGLVTGGVMTKNELREQMGLEPLDGLDEPVDPMALERARMDREDQSASGGRDMADDESASGGRPPPRGKGLKVVAGWDVDEAEVEDILAERLKLLNEPA
jgi:hypothetical protein